MADRIQSKPWLPYVAPMAIYLAFLSVQSSQNLVWVYPVMTIAVAAALWVFRKHYEELRSPMWSGGASLPRKFSGWTKGRDDTHDDTTCASQKRSYIESAATAWLLAAAVGLVAIAIWIAIDPYYPKLDVMLWRLESVVLSLFGKSASVPAETPFDPTTVQPVPLRWVFIGFRVVGAVIVVSLMEELFWRAFLIRWLVNADFKQVPVGTFSGPSFAITVALFAGEHREWLAGLICGAMYNWLLYKRKDVFSCVVAHAVSNAALAAWVLARGDWKSW